MYKEGKWAKQLLGMQKEDGSWGWFHSLSQFSDSPVTTEQALKRLEGLGYTMQDVCIQRAVTYMEDCLAGRRLLPDRAEKVSDWQVFSSLMIATWLRRFVPDHPQAMQVAKKWAEVITQVFADGIYDHQRYIQAYKAVLNPQYGRINGFMTFYPVSLLCGCLDEQTEKALCSYALDHPQGIYYIYERNLRDLPARFESRETSRWLAAIELMARYPAARFMLDLAVEWLEQNRNAEGRWDMGKEAKDGMYLPLSDDWRRKETRIADCTARIEQVIQLIKQERNV